MGPGHRSRGPCTNGARDPGGGERREKEHGSWVMDHDLQILTAWDMPAHREDSLRGSTARPRGSTSQLMYWRGKEIFGPHFEARPVSVRPRLKDEPKNMGSALRVRVKAQGRPLRAGAKRPHSPSLPLHWPGRGLWLGPGQGTCAGPSQRQSRTGTCLQPSCIEADPGRPFY